MKRDMTDKLISDCVRESVNWTCERCDKYFPEGSARKGLHNSHYFGRGGKSTRWFFDNCDSLCYGCHKFMERSRSEYDAFKRKKLGDTRFDALVLRANKPRKYIKADIKEMRDFLRQQLKDMMKLRMDGAQGFIILRNYD